jgi:hypothetical protein
MSKKTHGMEIGTTRGPLIMTMSEYPQEIPNQIAVGLCDLGKDGGYDDVYLSFQIYRLPDGWKPGDTVQAEEYIQAGGSAERLTVEIRRIESDGQPRQYTVGLPAAAIEPSETEVLRFGDNEIAVRRSELLTADQAKGLFQYYYERHSLPEGWHLRPIGTEVIRARDEANDEDVKPAASTAGIDSRDSFTGAAEIAPVKSSPRGHDGGPPEADGSQIDPN